MSPDSSYQGFTMRIGKFWISPKVLVMRFYQLLSYFRFIPFGFCAKPMSITGQAPHPLEPCEFRDFILNKMMFPDNYLRAVYADKFAARGIVAQTIGKKYIPEIYDICDTPEELSKIL